MPTIIATAGAPNANSYATIAESDAYHLGHIDPAVWDDADLDVQQRALITATRLLDQHLVWIGYVADDQQALAWPRIWARTRNGFLFPTNAIPQAVKDATSELARRLIELGTIPADSVGDDELKSLKAGPVSLEFNVGASPDPLPDPVYQMVKFLAVPDTANRGIASVPVIRT